MSTFQVEYAEQGHVHVEVFDAWDAQDAYGQCRQSIPRDAEIIDVIELGTVQQFEEV